MYRQLKVPFVCLYLPSVGLRDAHHLPFIGFFYHSVGNRRFRAGFTLIELVIAIVIIGILAGMAAPSFRSFLRSSQLSAAANDLLADITFARSEALKRQGGSIAGQVGQVVVCVSSTGTGCTNAPDTWSSGWIVFWDQNASGTLAGANEQLLRHRQPLPATLTAVPTPAGTLSIAYTPLGLPVSGPLTVQIADAEIAKSRAVGISPGGQVSVR